MATDEGPDSRFLFPDMFSFSFDPEILTFLWGLCARRTEDGLDYRPVLPKSGLLQVFVPLEGQHANLFTFVRYAVVTSGMIVFVGLSSYSAFRVLQKFRYEGFDGLKRSVLNLFNSLKKPTKKLQSVRSLELVLRRNNRASSLRKRPSDLQLTNYPNNGSINNGNRAELNGNKSVPMKGLHATPTNGEVASGDEDPDDLQTQYFGPTGNNDNTPLRIASILSSSPVSPESALHARYESLRRSPADVSHHRELSS